MIAKQPTSNTGGKNDDYHCPPPVCLEDLEDHQVRHRHQGVVKLESLRLLKWLRVHYPHESVIGDLERCRLDEAGHLLEMTRRYCLALLAIQETEDLEACHRIAFDAIEQVKSLTK